MKTFVLLLVVVALFGLSSALRVHDGPEEEEKKWKPAAIVNVLETNEIKGSVDHINRVLRHEPAAAKEDPEDADISDVGQDDATLMGEDSCGALPSDKKDNCADKKKKAARAKKKAAEKAKLKKMIDKINIGF